MSDVFNTGVDVSFQETGRYPTEEIPEEDLDQDLETLDDEDYEDQLLEDTPADVVSILGFDPIEFLETQQEKEAIQFGKADQLRAPIGGIWINGVFYVGGRWIPETDLVGTNITKENIQEVASKQQGKAAVVKPFKSSKAGVAKKIGNTVLHNDMLKLKEDDPERFKKIAKLAAVKFDKLFDAPKTLNNNKLNTKGITSVDASDWPNHVHAKWAINAIFLMEQEAAQGSYKYANYIDPPDTLWGNHIKEAKEKILANAEELGDAKVEAMGIGVDPTIFQDSWKKIEDKKGTNPGGLYETPQGKKYVKWSYSKKHAQNEVLGARLLNAMGLPTLDYEFVYEGGKVNWHDQEPTWKTDVPMSKRSYGGAIFDDQGRILLREPTNHYGGYAWTFPKGGIDPGETPDQAALREVLEETGYSGELLAQVPGQYKGDTSSNFFFLMQAGNQDIEKMLANGETNDVKFMTYEEAKNMISQSTNEAGKKRDLEILEAAYKTYNTHKENPKPLPNKELVGTMTSWQDDVSKISWSDSDKSVMYPHYVPHALIANWDVVGTGQFKYDNLVMIDGQATTVDTGGSLLFRAMGGEKGNAFGNSVVELDTYLDKDKYPIPYSAFKGMSVQDKLASAEAVWNLSESQIESLVNNTMTDDVWSQAEKQKVIDTLKARRLDVLEKMTTLAEQNGLEFPPGNTPTAPETTISPDQYKKKVQSYVADAANDFPGASWEDLEWAQGYMDVLDSNGLANIVQMHGTDSMLGAVAARALKLKGRDIPSQEPKKETKKSYPSIELSDDQKADIAWYTSKMDALGIGKDYAFDEDNKEYLTNKLSEALAMENFPLSSALTMPEDQLIDWAVNGNPPYKSMSLFTGQAQIIYELRKHYGLLGEPSPPEEPGTLAGAAKSLKADKPEVKGLLKELADNTKPSIPDSWNEKTKKWAEEGASYIEKYYYDPVNTKNLEYAWAWWGAHSGQEGIPTTSQLIEALNENKPGNKNYDAILSDYYTLQHYKSLTGDYTGWEDPEVLAKEYKEKSYHDPTQYDKYTTEQVPTLLDELQYDSISTVLDNWGGSPVFMDMSPHEIKAFIEEGIDPIKEGFDPMDGWDIDEAKILYNVYNKLGLISKFDEEPTIPNALQKKLDENETYKTWFEEAKNYVKQGDLNSVYSVPPTYSELFKELNEGGYAPGHVEAASLLGDLYLLNYATYIANNPQAPAKEAKEVKQPPQTTQLKAPTKPKTDDVWPMEVAKVDNGADMDEILESVSPFTGTPDDHIAQIKEQIEDLEKDGDPYSEIPQWEEAIYVIEYAKWKQAGGVPEPEPEPAKPEPVAIPEPVSIPDPPAIVSTSKSAKTYQKKLKVLHGLALAGDWETLAKTKAFKSGKSGWAKKVHDYKRQLLALAGAAGTPAAIAPSSSQEYEAVTSEPDPKNIQKLLGQEGKKYTEAELKSTYNSAVSALKNLDLDEFDKVLAQGLQTVDASQVDDIELLLKDAVKEAYKDGIEIPLPDNIQDAYTYNSLLNWISTGDLDANVPTVAAAFDTWESEGPESQEWKNKLINLQGMSSGAFVGLSIPLPPNKGVVTSLKEAAYVVAIEALKGNSMKGGFDEDMEYIVKVTPGSIGEDEKEYIAELSEWVKDYSKGPKPIPKEIPAPPNFTSDTSNERAKKAYDMASAGNWHQLDLYSSTILAQFGPNTKSKLPEYLNKLLAANPNKATIDTDNLVSDKINNIIASKLSKVSGSILSNDEIFKLEKMMEDAGYEYRNKMVNALSKNDLAGVRSVVEEVHKKFGEFGDSESKAVGQVEAAASYYYKKLSPPPVTKKVTIAELDKAIQPINTGQKKASIARFGRFAVLGSAGQIDKPEMSPLTNESYVNKPGSTRAPENYTSKEMLFDHGQANRKKHSDWYKSLPPDQRSAIYDYTRNSYYPEMNRWLSAAAKGVAKPPDAEYGQRAISVAKALDKAPILPKGLTIQRKARLSNKVTKMLLDNPDLMEGSVIQDGTIISTSGEDKWSGQVYMHITIGDGVRGVYIDPHSAASGEKEFLLPPNTRFYVNKIRKWNSSDEIVMEVTVLPHVEGQATMHIEEYL